MIFMLLLCLVDKHFFQCSVLAKEFHFSKALLILQHKMKTPNLKETSVAYLKLSCINNLLRVASL